MLYIGAFVSFLLSFIIKNVYYLSFSISLNARQLNSEDTTVKSYLGHKNFGNSSNDIAFETFSQKKVQINWETFVAMNEEKFVENNFQPPAEFSFCETNSENTIAESHCVNVSA